MSERETQEQNVTAIAIITEWIKFPWQHNRIGTETWNIISSLYDGADALKVVC